MNTAYPNAAPIAMDPAAQTSKDEGDLRMLSIFHYVWSGFLMVFALFMFAYFCLGAWMATTQMPASGANPEALHTVEGITLGIGGFFFVVMMVLFVLHLMAAAGLRKRTRFVLIQVMSALMCTSIPLGTALGVWTFMVMQRPSVKGLFGRR